MFYVVLSDRLLLSRKRAFYMQHILQNTTLIQMPKYKICEKKTLIKRFSLEEKVLNQFCPCTIRGFRYPCYSLPWYIFLIYRTSTRQTSTLLIKLCLLLILGFRVLTFTLNFYLIIIYFFRELK